MRFLLRLIVLTCMTFLQLQSLKGIHFTNKGHYAVSNYMYQNAVHNHYAFKKIGTYQIAHKKYDKYDDLRHCTRLCVAQPSCKSFVYRPSEKKCVFSSFDKCVDKSVFLASHSGSNTYDIFDGTSKPMETCYDKCMKENSNDCTPCGRPTCSEAKCDSCLKTCWELESPQSKNLLPVNLDKLTEVRCSGGWQLLWDGSFRHYSYIFSVPVMLKLEIHLENGTILTSLFHSIEWVNHQTLRVGKFINGTAGNYWNAPFDSLPRREFLESNCKPFFAKNSDCAVSYVVSYDDQIAANATFIQRKYFWMVDNKDILNIKNILMHVTVTT